MEKESAEFSEELLEDIRLEIEERKGDHLLDLYRETHPHLVLLQGDTPPAILEPNISAMEVDGRLIFRLKPNSKLVAKKEFSQLLALGHGMNLCLPHSLQSEWGTRFGTMPDLLAN
jgi:hypothetical protein